MSNQFSLKKPQRFAFARHEFSVPRQSDTHFDLFLELENRLQTWRWMYLLGDQRNTHCLRIPDHRLDYLVYQGPISNDRGELAQLISGELLWVVNEPATIEVKLFGAEQQWHYRFRRAEATTGSPEDRGDQWSIELLFNGTNYS